VALPLGVVKEEVAVLIALVRRNCCAVGAAVRRAVDDEDPGAVEEKTGPATVRAVPQGLLDVLPVHAHARYFAGAEGARPAVVRREGGLAGSVARWPRPTEKRKQSIFTPRMRRTRAPVLAGGPGGVWLR